MGPLERPKVEIRQILRKHLEDLEHCLAGELTEKLAERKPCFSLGVRTLKVRADYVGG